MTAKSTLDPKGLEAAETPMAELVDRAIADMATGRWSMLLREEGDFGASQHRTADIVKEIARRAYLTAVVPADIGELVKRLRSSREIETWYDGGHRPVALVNPDGPEAAATIERLVASGADARRKALEEAAGVTCLGCAAGDEVNEHGYHCRGTYTFPCHATAIRALEEGK